MQTLPRRSGVFVFAAIAIGAGMFFGFARWPQPLWTVEFLSLILAAILTSALTARQSPTRDWAIMRPSFVVDFISLVFLGPHATMLVVTAGTVTEGLTDSSRTHPIRRTLLNAATVMAAIQAAGAAYRALGGTMG